MGSVLADAVATLPHGSVTRVGLTDLDGLLVRTLLELQATVGFGLEFVVAKPPLSLIPPPVGTGSGTDAFLQWAFHPHGVNASCVLWPSPASPTRRLYFRQTVPLMSFGYSVVTTRPRFNLPTALDRVFMWTKPFSPGVWCLLMTAIVVYAIGMPLCVRRTPCIAGPLLALTWLRAGLRGATPPTLGPGGMTAARWWATRCTWAPWARASPTRMSQPAARGVPRRPSTPLRCSSSSAHTPPTWQHVRITLLRELLCSLRVLLMTRARAELTTMDPAVQVVQNIFSFNPRVPACARSSSTLSTLLNSSYPNAAAALSAQNTMGSSTSASRDALQAVLAGHCDGAIVPQTEAAWIMGVNDTRGDFCELQIVGAPEGSESLPLTFSKTAMTDAQLESLNMAIEELQRAGDFILDLEDSLFPSGPRSVCAAEDSRDSAAATALTPGQRVEVIDLAGAFLLQAIGFSMGFLIHCCKLGHRRATAWRAAKHAGVAGEVEAPAAAPEEASAAEGGREVTKRHEALGRVAHHAE